ncbi:indole-diterpene biosynthesis protein PaxU [Histoplasma capsulatum H143]|uniref:Indole-diterpene biosynthesis protein PaxU n=1 Tax=Ajellomyces capsulatus (strain H143) TaxID=544712 RepID=C6HGD0_AJECH|nr:indole-diterpene biosynthesis protein PaxU [Histoplasma capsulatum H143]
MVPVAWRHGNTRETGHKMVDLVEHFEFPEPGPTTREGIAYPEAIIAMASNTTSGSSPERFDEIFSSFTKLSHTIYIRDKPTSASPSPESPRETICLLFWMDAQPRHTAKYVNEYIKVLPNALIICMRTLSTDLLFRGSKKSHRLRVVPLRSWPTRPPCHRQGVFIRAP